jgi:hypothetical protein
MNTIEIVKDANGKEVSGECSECLTVALLDASATPGWMFCPKCNDWREVDREISAWDYE